MEKATQDENSTWSFMDIRRHKDGKHQCFGSVDSHSTNKARLGFYASGVWGCQEKTPCHVVIGVVHSWNTSYIGQADCSLYRHTLGISHTYIHTYIHNIHTYIHIFIHTFSTYWFAYLRTYIRKLSLLFHIVWIHIHIYTHTVHTVLFTYPFYPEIHLLYDCCSHFIDPPTSSTPMDLQYFQ